MFAPREFPRFGQYFCVNIGKLRLAIPTAPDAASCVLNGFAPIRSVHWVPPNVTPLWASHRAMGISRCSRLVRALLTPFWATCPRHRLLLGSSRKYSALGDLPQQIGQLLRRLLRTLWPQWVRIHQKTRSPAHGRRPATSWGSHELSDRTGLGTG